MRRFFFAALPAIALLMPGSLGAADLAVAPTLTAALKGADPATPGPSEAAEDRGREIRERRKWLTKLERRYSKEMDQCQDGNRRACDDARDTYAEMQQIIPTIPPRS